MRNHRFTGEGEWFFFALKVQFFKVKFKILGTILKRIRDGKHKLENFGDEEGVKER